MQNNVTLTLKFLPTFRSGSEPVNRFPLPLKYGPVMTSCVTSVDDAMYRVAD